MNRRGFLKLGAKALAAVAVAPCLPAAAKLVIESTATGPVPVVFGAMRSVGTVTYTYFDVEARKTVTVTKEGLCFYDLPIVGKPIFPTMKARRKATLFG